MNNSGEYAGILTRAAIGVGALKKLTVITAGFLLAIVSFMSSATAQAFTLAVRHNHFRGHCSGKLLISEDGIEYSTDYVKHRRKWSYVDLKRVEISTPKELKLQTYEDKKYRLGPDQEFDFHVVEGEINSDIYQFLLSKTTRPLITGVAFPTGPFAYEIPAKHRQFQKGTQGLLKIGDNEVVYETPHPKDSRIWLYKDIQNIGLLDPYNFRISTLLETYTFDLKIAMTREQYDYVWERVYRLGIPFQK
ncbi:MAG TPA: hypothetical protein VGL91_24975 [Acidobacteriota bacterium]|jgi:hypothetical protein